MADPITLEVLRCKLESIADDGAKAIQRTAISPVLAAGDCSCAIYDPEGALIMGGGHVLSHFHTGANGVHAINQTHRDTIADGDIFLVNDPYNGGGFHAQDVFIHIPVFVDGTLTAWVGASGHMMDMGGSLLGSFVPDATECYQEAIRLPPVRIYRRGEEQADIWAILRNNIRLSTLVEMDMRALISGATLVCKQLTSLIVDQGPEQFGDCTQTLCDLTELEIRRRLSQLEDGVYRARTWCEWGETLYDIPCVVIVSDDRIIFDFQEASDQTTHYFNSKAYVLQSYLGVLIGNYFAADLPINEGLFRAFEVKCREGSILDALPPAPIAGPHLYACQMAIESATFAVNLALAASPEATGRRNMAGPGAHSGYPLHTVACTGLRGQPDGWLLLDSTSSAASAGFDRDAPDMSIEVVGRPNGGSMVDIEVLESWYPILVDWRGPRRQPEGAGTFRAGSGISMRYRLAGTDVATIALLGNRESVPIPGHAGGLPGSATHFAIVSEEGEARSVACNQQGVILRSDEAFLFEAPSGGGWGDPLDRDVKMVEADVRHERLSPDDAQRIYGVVVGDAGRTEHVRADMRQERLALADPARSPLDWTDERRQMAEGVIAPLYAGIEQRGAVAVSARSGAPLAVSPASWTDGCPTLRTPLASRPRVEMVAYLEPVTGHYLMVDVVAGNVERAFNSAPERWRLAGATLAPN